MNRRDDLPIGYQFGDAGRAPRPTTLDFPQWLIDESRRLLMTRELRMGETIRVALPKRWRAPHENQAEQFRAKATWGGFTANVIEGEIHD